MSKGIIGKVLNRSYSFPKSKNELELLRRMLKGEVQEKELDGGYDWRYYSAVFNTCTEFGEQVLGNIVLVDPFNNRVVDMQEEYMPSYPPMSPITHSYFNTWLALDAPINESLTLGLLYSRYITEKKTMQYAYKAMDVLNASFASFYQVVGGDLQRTILWDILGKREVGAHLAIDDLSKATYHPDVGDVWYARILPPLREGDFPSVVFNTVYVFRVTARDDWEAFFARQTARLTNGRDGLIAYLKRGSSFGYWLEFIFQTYVGHTGEAIFLEGLPDIKESRPISDLDGGRLV